jgi:thioredoxin-related protein
MAKIRFNITTNFKGTEYRRGDEMNMTESEIKLFAGTGSSGMPHIVRTTKGGKNGSKDAKSGSASQ